MAYGERRCVSKGPLQSNRFSFSRGDLPRPVQFPVPCKPADAAGRSTVAAVETATPSPGGPRAGVRSRLASNTAASSRRPWYVARSNALSVAFFNAYLKSRGLPTLNRRLLA